MGTYSIDCFIVCALQPLRAGSSEIKLCNIMKLHFIHTNWIWNDFSQTGCRPGTCAVFEPLQKYNNTPYTCQALCFAQLATRSNRFITHWSEALNLISMKYSTRAAYVRSLKLYCARLPPPEPSNSDESNRIHHFPVARQWSHHWYTVANLIWQSVLNHTYGCWAFLFTWRLKKPPHSRRSKSIPSPPPPPSAPLIHLLL